MLTKEKVERELKYAKDPDKQLEIIAQLNDVKVKDLKRLLDGSVEMIAPAEKPKKPPRPKKRGWHRWADEELIELARLRAAGVSAAEIGKKYGRSVRTVNKLLDEAVRRCGVRVRRSYGWAASELETAIEMRKRGIDPVDIAEKFGRRPASVKAMLKRHMGDGYENKS